ncbi:hypothetical protein AMTR_s00086p00150500 [Amborella trichopoda]|uniref:Uncharacterized protein n=1 Tax=Amborella trichopoda TaxID=13333 RepID=W1NZ05_AMBTC|nr:hypothetical protein AMTR_s00086p00150500 [Amborella trichopoda]
MRKDLKYRTKKENAKRDFKKKGDLEMHYAHIFPATSSAGSAVSTGEAIPNYLHIGGRGRPPHLIITMTSISRARVSVVDWGWDLIIREEAVPQEEPAGPPTLSKIRPFVKDSGDVYLRSRTLCRLSRRRTRRRRGGFRLTEPCGRSSAKTLQGNATQGVQHHAFFLFPMGFIQTPFLDWD